MPRKPRQISLTRENDTEAMRKAITDLSDFAGLRRTSEYQLKIGNVNFYPDTGTVHFDRQAPEKSRGLSEFIRVLEMHDLDRRKSLVLDISKYRK